MKGSPLDWGPPLEGIFPFGCGPFRGVSSKVPHLQRVPLERWMQVPPGENPFGGSPRERWKELPHLEMSPERGQGVHLEGQKRVLVGQIPLEKAKEVSHLETSE